MSSILPQFRRDSSSLADCQEKWGNRCLSFTRIAGKGDIYDYKDNRPTLSPEQRTHWLALRILAGLVAILLLPMTLIGIVLTKWSTSYNEALSKINAVVTPSVESIRSVPKAAPKKNKQSKATVASSSPAAVDLSKKQPKPVPSPMLPSALPIFSTAQPTTVTERSTQSPLDVPIATPTGNTQSTTHVATSASPIFAPVVSPVPSVSQPAENIRSTTYGASAAAMASANVANTPAPAVSPAKAEQPKSASPIIAPVVPSTPSLEKEWEKVESLNWNDAMTDLISYAEANSKEKAVIAEKLRYCFKALKKEIRKPEGHIALNEPPEELIIFPSPDMRKKFENILLRYPTDGYTHLEASLINDGLYVRLLWSAIQSDPKKLVGALRELREKFNATAVKTFFSWFLPEKDIPLWWKALESDFLLGDERAIADLCFLYQQTILRQRVQLFQCLWTSLYEEIKKSPSQADADQADIKDSPILQLIEQQEEMPWITTGDDLSYALSALGKYKLISTPKAKHRQALIKLVKDDPRDPELAIIALAGNAFIDQIVHTAEKVGGYISPEIKELKAKIEKFKTVLAEGEAVEKESAKEKAVEKPLAPAGVG